MPHCDAVGYTVAYLRGSEGVSTTPKQAHKNATKKKEGSKGKKEGNMETKRPNKQGNIYIYHFKGSKVQCSFKKSRSLCSFAYVASRSPYFLAQYTIQGFFCKRFFFLRIENLKIFKINYHCLASLCYDFP